MVNATLLDSCAPNKPTLENLRGKEQIVMYMQHEFQNSQPTTLKSEL